MSLLKTVRNQWRAYSSLPFWAPFRLGYMAALDDADRTGLVPNREDTKERAAEKSFCRLYGIEHDG